MTDWRDHRVPVFNGTFDTRAASGLPYGTLPLVRVLGSHVASKAKMQGPAFLPTTYAEHDARCHAVQRERGRYVALVADVDSGNHDAGLIAAIIDRYAPASTAVFYTSPHTRPGDMRWRVVLPMNDLLPFAAWRDAQLALFNGFRLSGVECDTAMARAAQPIFLPNVPTRHAKTGEALRDEWDRPLHFVRRVIRPNQRGLCLRSGLLANGIAAIRAARASKAREQAERQARAQRPAPGYVAPSLIAAFNAAADLPTLFTRYGYAQCPGSPADWRSPHQSSTTFATRIVGKGKWVSLSGSDAAAGLGADKDGTRWGDAFDLFCHFEFSGNRMAALRQLASEQREVVR